MQTQPLSTKFHQSLDSLQAQDLKSHQSSSWKSLPWKTPPHQTLYKHVSCPVPFCFSTKQRRPLCVSTNKSCVRFVGWCEFVVLVGSRLPGHLSLQGRAVTLPLGKPSLQHCNVFIGKAFPFIMVALTQRACQRSAYLCPRWEQRERESSWLSETILIPRYVVSPCWALRGLTATD